MNSNRRLIKYEQDINKYYSDKVTEFMGIVLKLNTKEKSLLNKILDMYHDSLVDIASLRNAKMTEKLTYKLELSKVMKKMCDQDWNIAMSILDPECSNYGKYSINDVSIINKEFIIAVMSSCRSTSEKANIIHSITRIGEFFYLTDEEMDYLGSDIESFIQAGDCCLFANNGPYRSAKLCSSVYEDIEDKEYLVREYCLREEIDKDNLPTAKEVITTMHKVANDLSNTPIHELPDSYRGLAQVVRKIRKAFSNLDESYYYNGIPEEDMMTKLSGFCLNKEPNFRELCACNDLPSWKNPEGSIYYGGKNYPFPGYMTKNMLKFKDWDMNRIYYSIGKGVWFKIRYVGQPPAHFQNIAEKAAGTIKKIIREHQKNFNRERIEHPDRIPHYYDASCINIYNNYSELKSLVLGMSDGYAQDFTAYSDYLNRNIFDWIMDKLFGLPKWYRDMIMHMMSVPVRINGKDYHYLHGSVMGIKFNFLLITFANAVMWMISNYITGKHDKAKFMGDDFISVLMKGRYNTRDEQVRFCVCAYFNCVINRSKTETLSGSGYVSFCKRYFNKHGIQITGIGGEFSLKQKVFLNDLSMSINVIRSNDIDLNELEINDLLKSMVPLMQIAYNKFYRKGDPDLSDMIHTASKIPYYYGGISLEDPSDEMDRILLQSVLNLVNQMFEEHLEETQVTPRQRVRRFISNQLSLNNMPIENPYYNVMKGVSQYSQDMERIQRYVNDMIYVLNSPSYELADIKRARSSSQSLLEIILHRDSRLKSNVSTKDRINFDRDNDRVSKIRYNYLITSLESAKSQIDITALDNLILRGNLSSSDARRALDGYLEYLKLRKSTGSRLVSYYDAKMESFVGLEIHRIGADGREKIFYKRITSQDSEYQKAYRDSNGVWHGQFINYDQLNESEKKLYSYVKQDYVRKSIKNLEDQSNQAISNAALLVYSNLINSLISRFE